MTLLPLHETINRWIDEAYIPQQPQAMIKTLSRMACSNLTALASMADSFPVGDGLVYAGYEEVECPIISAFVTYRKEYPLHRTGALKFKFAPAQDDGSGFEALVIAAWVSDEDIGVQMIVMACMPRAYASHWLTFEQECHRIASSAITYRDKVYIVGGAEDTFDATVDWNDVYLPADLKAGIMQDVDAFFEKGVAIYQRLKINPFRKLLLAGVPGTGKTMLCSALAKWAQAKGRFVIYVSGANQFGAKFWKIHQALDMAAESDSPTIVIVEELDAYLDEESKAQLLNVLDGSETPMNPRGTIMIATTNHPEIIDNRVMKRPGRLDRIFIIPELEDEQSAEDMLRAYLGDDWCDQHRTIIPRLLNKPAAFIREVALSALTVAAYQDLDGLPLEVLVTSLESLEKQIEAKDDFLTAHKRTPIGLIGQGRRNGNRS
ncbi:MAG: ATP-binding protein [Anaerolineae bacterium]|nr:ATP-binding protein [Anaerolineae bacterium]